MLLEIFFAAASLANTASPGAVPWERVVEAAWVTRNIVLSEEPLFRGERAAERTGELLVIWAGYESWWDTQAIGDRQSLAGPSWGASQIKPMWFEGHLLSEVRTSLKLDIELMLHIMRRLRDACGSVERGLGAYASGRCGGALRLVRARCQRIGGCG